MKSKSITKQIALLFGLLLFIICAGLGFCAFFSARDALQGSIDQDLIEIAEADAKVISEKINTQLNALESLANSPWIKDDQLTLNEKLEFLNHEVKRSGHKNIMLIDADGTAHYTTGETNNVAEREYFQKALAGESTVSDPMISKSDGSVVVVFAAPIKQGNRVIGVLAARRDGNALSEYANEMEFNQHEVFMVSKDGTFIAHSDQERVQNMENIIEGNEDNPELADLINLLKRMIAGEAGAGEYTFNGVAKYMAFYPVEGTDWSLAVTAPKSIMLSKIYDLTTMMIVLSILFLVLGIAITILIARSISRPIKEVTKHLNVMATGNFTADLPKKLMDKQDEIGSLAHSLDKMQNSMRSMLKSVMDECTNVSQMLSDINTHMADLNESIEEISSTTEQLSAGTQETAAASEEIDATSQEVEKAIQSVAEKAQEGAATVAKVNKISAEMRESAISSKQGAMQIYGKTKADMERALEQAKAVNQINELSDTILDITAQTNLLALNAAIEAARAGEAGQGFAVVAEEIRNLAESSKTSVSRIQEVTKDVLTVVNALSSSSMEIMEFIDKKVLQDYESVVQNSERYNKLSKVINDIVTDFSATSEELLASMDNMVHAIDQISVSANEEASGATNIAQRAEVIVNKAENVINLASTSNKKSDELIKLVQQFKI